jgi:hypothetical protein
MEAIEQNPRQQEYTDAEIERLRARVADLEDQLADQAARTNQIVAATQERVYWLDRWHLDLNALMARPGAAEFRAVVRVARGFVWRAKRLKRRLAG